MTTKKQVPTINKVKEMINESLVSLTNKSVYKISELTVNKSDSYYGPYSNLARRYYSVPEKYKIKIGIFQGSNNKPTIILGTSTSDIVYKFDYTLDYDFIYNDSIDLYTSSPSKD